MNPAQARQLIKETFTQPFDRDRFGRFAAELLNHVDGEKAFRQTLVKEAYRAGINHYERLGTYTDPDGEKIDVLIVHMKKETGLRRARTFQRNFVADYLVTRGQKEAALVAFVPPDAEDWRFSLVKMEYRAEEETATPTAPDGGQKQMPPKVVVRTDLTPAVRLSFLVGRNERSHTAQAQLVKILADTEHDPPLAALEKAFSVETVSDEFFEQYRILFLRLRQAVDAVSAKDANVRSEFTTKDISPVDFSKKLLGQIVFLYFLQKKGWLGLTRKQAWGDGPRDFLRQLFDGKVIPHKNFFNDVLEPLFYEALAKEHDEDFNTHFQRKIPFLNGGLFDPIRDYDWVETDILLPNDLFANSEPAAHGDIGTGILDVFDRFNFTVDEAEPLEKDVAVDPEMLGKVFERLLDVQERKGKGSFYTPREIVHYMCRQSLSYCLQHRMAGKCAADDIARFLDLGDRSADFEANLNDTHWNKRLPDSIREHAPEIDAALETLAVCDPAIGSGAFPVGMLLELVRAREILASLDKMPPRSRYELKAHAIQNCLYGVDIDPGAVDVAKLRLWLSLVVDEHDRSRIEPLPNLDYKIMQGNSLLDTFEGTKLFDASLLPESNAQTDRRIEEIKAKIVEWQRTLVELHKEGKLSRVKRKEIEQEVKKLQDRLAALNGDNGQAAKAVVRENVVRDDYLTAAFSGASLRKAQELRELHKVFFQTTSRQKRRELRRKLDALEWDFIAATLREQGQTEAEKELAKQRNAAVKPFFLWQLHFAEVFQDKGGFDIVIGNPPYVRADAGAAHVKMRREIELSGEYETLWEKWDLYIPFIERGYKFLKPGGVISYIVSDAFCQSKYAQKAQNWYLMNAAVLRLDFFSMIQIFDAAVRNVTFFFQRADGQMNEPERRVHEGEFGKVSVLGSDEQPQLTCRAFLPEDETYAKFSEPTRQLDEVCYLSVGMVVHADEKVAQGAFELDDVVSERKDKTHPKAFVEGKNLARWLPSSMKWLEWGTHRAPAMFRRKTFEELYDVPEKLLLLRMAGKDIRVSYDDIGLLCNHTSIVCLPWHSLAGVRNNSLKKAARYVDEDPPRPDLPRREDLEATSRRFEVKYLLAVLHSNIARDFLLAHRRSNTDLYPEDWKKLPIPDATAEQQSAIVALVDQILAAKKHNPKADISALEQETDRLVRGLYGLTPEEIAQIEGAVANTRRAGGKDDAVEEDADQ
jgi:hypothetical protein